VRDAVERIGKDLGAEIKVTGFVRFQLGETQSAGDAEGEQAA
jgi:hypothetical protein